MSRADTPLAATIAELTAAGIAYRVSKSGKHHKVFPDGLPMIVCSGTAGDHRAVANAVTVVRRCIRRSKDV